MRIELEFSGGKPFIRFPPFRLPARIMHAFVNTQTVSGIYNPFVGFAVSTDGMDIEKILQMLLGESASIFPLSGSRIGLHLLPSPFVCPPENFSPVERTGCRPVSVRRIGEVIRTNLWENPVLSVSLRKADCGEDSECMLTSRITWNGGVVIRTAVAVLDRRMVERYGLDEGVFHLVAPGGWLRKGDGVYVVEIGKRPFSSVHLAIGGHVEMISGYQAACFLFTVHRESDSEPD